MAKEIPYICMSMVEANPIIFVFVLLIYSETAFELNRKKPVTTYMIRNKMGSLPVITEAKGRKAIIRKNS